MAQELPLETLTLLDALNKKVTEGWQLLSVSSISSGTPFTVYSGIQQTGAGSANSERPDQIDTTSLSTRRLRREDYFGRGANNASFFSIPIHVAGGTGPNQGRFGTLGRNTFRRPAFYQFDISLVKDSPVGRRKSGSDLVDVQFRSEFFNVVNLGLPANTILGSGFGLTNRTAGSSRQIQTRPAESGTRCWHQASEWLQATRLRAGNWLNRDQAQSFLEKADGVSLRNVRDVWQGHWAIVDLRSAKNQMDQQLRIGIERSVFLCATQGLTVTATFLAHVLLPDSGELPPHCSIVTSIYEWSNFAPSRRSFIK